MYGAQKIIHSKYNFFIRSVWCADDDNHNIMITPELVVAVFPSLVNRAEELERRRWRRVFGPEEEDGREMQLITHKDRE